MPEKQLRSNGPVPPTRRSADPVAAVLERVVSATDPRLRGSSGYARKLRGPVEHALQYVNQLLTALSPPLEVSHAAYTREASLQALFPSVDRLREVLLEGRARQDLLRQLEPEQADSAYGTLLLRRRLNRAQDDSQAGPPNHFDWPLLTLVASSENELAEQLRTRALGFLAECALARIVGESSQVADQGVPLELLRAKLKVVERQGSGLAGLCASRKPSLEATEAARRRLGQIERDLSTVHAGAAALGRAMAAVREVMESPGRFLGHRRVEVKLNGANGADRHVSCDELHLDGQRRLGLILARVPMAELPVD
jgi:hypothetical protein